jgi:hypothetical protein
VNNPLKAVTPVKCYAAIVKNEVELLSSSSGGLATAISKMARFQTLSDTQNGSTAFRFIRLAVLPLFLFAIIKLL